MFNHLFRAFDDAIFLTTRNQPGHKNLSVCAGEPANR